MTTEHKARYAWTRRNRRSIWFVLPFVGLAAGSLVRNFGMSPLPVLAVFAVLVIGWGLWDYRATVPR